MLFETYGLSKSVLREAEDSLPSLTRHLTFYPGAVLHRIGRSPWPLDDRYVLVHHSGRIELDGRSSAIHEANAAVPLRLDERNVLDYLCFFCAFTRGEEGPFWILAPDLPLHWLVAETAPDLAAAIVPRPLEAQERLLQNSEIMRDCG